MTKPRSTHQVVSLTLWGVGSACLLAASAVDALARDKKTTAAYLAENKPAPQNEAAQIDAEPSADEPAGDPSSPFAGDDLDAVKLPGEVD